MLKHKLNCKKESEDCQCNELGERSKKAESRYLQLEFDIEKMNRECEALVAKLKELDVEKIKMNDELKVLKRMIKEFKGNDKNIFQRGSIIEPVDLTNDNDEEDQVLQLMIENKVLECEKNKAEKEVEFWKDKFRKLESWVLDQSFDCSALKDDWLLAAEKNVELSSTNESLYVESWKKHEVYGLETKSCARTGLDSLKNHGEVVNLDIVGSTSASACKGIGDLQAVGSPDHGMSYRKSACIDSEVQHGRKDGKHLTLEEQRTPSMKLAPSTPGLAKSSSHGTIHIIHSDDEPNVTPVQQPICDSPENGRAHCVIACGFQKVEKRLKERYCDQNEEEEMNFCRENTSRITASKRKRPINIIASDSENDSDDRVPIWYLKQNKNVQEEIPVREISIMNSSLGKSISSDNDMATGAVASAKRRLFPLSKLIGKSQEDKFISEVNCARYIPTNKDIEDDESEDVGRSDEDKDLCSDANYALSIPPNGNAEDDESEEVSSKTAGESLDGFIDDASNVSINGADGDVSGKSHDLSDDDVDFDVILSKLKRDKMCNNKWEFEADMLAAFGKDPELCMKALCALYRQQTTDEKISKETLCYNKRGFSKFDALRGSKVAEFLTDGDPGGDLKKSVEELQEYDPGAVEMCRTLATRYSKQLFAIYNSNQDPFFHP